MIDLLTIVPTRSRPESVEKVVAAWELTGAFEEGAELMFVVDRDDPRCAEYRTAIVAATQQRQVGAVYEDAWRPLVPKLNRIAVSLAAGRYAHALGFAGDDHLPRTVGWVGRYLTVLYQQPGIVYCDDGYQHENIPTQWAMTADIVRALGRMVPAPVEHLYCDNAVRDLGQGADCLTYLPDVMIEHMHPVVGKGSDDEQYRKVNSSEQYRTDRPAYRGWVRSGGLAHDVEIVRTLVDRGEAAV